MSTEPESLEQGSQESESHESDSQDSGSHKSESQRSTSPQPGPQRRRILNLADEDGVTHPFNKYGKIRVIEPPEDQSKVYLYDMKLSLTVILDLVDDLPESDVKMFENSHIEAKLYREIEEGHWMSVEIRDEPMKPNTEHEVGNYACEIKVDYRRFTPQGWHKYMFQLKCKDQNGKDLQFNFESAEFNV